MTDIIKGTSGQNRYLLMTGPDANRMMSSEPNLNFYRCEQLGEFDAVLGELSVRPKIELCYKLKIGYSTYDSFLTSQFKDSLLQMYCTGTSHYTSPNNKLAENSESTYYLAPAIYGVEYFGVKFFNFASNPNVTRRYIDRFNLDGVKIQQLIHDFYSNTGSMFRSGPPILPSPTHYEDHLINMLNNGDAIIIEKSKSLFSPFSDIVSSAVSVGVLRSSKIVDTCPAIELFVIKCAHSGEGRDFQLDVINTDHNFNDYQHVIQVVAQSDSPEKMTINYKKPNCTKGDKECPSIIIDGGDYSNQKTTTSPFEINVKPYKKEKDLSFIEFLQTYLLPDMRDLEPEVYSVKALGCSDVNSYKAEVHCYPTFSWAANAEFGYVIDKEKRADIKTGLVLKGEVSYLRDGKSVKFDKESEREKKSAFPSLQDVLSGLFDKIDKMNEPAPSGDSNTSSKDGKTPTKSAKKRVKLDIIPPKLKLDGKLELKEQKKSGGVGMAGDVAISMSPLIGFVGEVDIIEWILLRRTGPLALAIIEARSLAAGESNPNQKFKANIYLKLIPEGDISADFKWIKDIDDSWLSTEGEKTGEARAGTTFKLEGGADAEGDMYWVKIEAGAKVGLEGAEEEGGVGIVATLTATTAEDKPALAGQLKFTGMKLTYSCYVKYSVKGSLTEKKVVYGGDNESDDDAAIPGTDGMVEKLGELPIFDVVTWPSDPEPQPINQGLI